MNFKKRIKFIAIFLFIFCGLSLFPTVVGKNLIVPTKIKDVFPDAAVAEIILRLLSKSSSNELVTQSELDSIKVFTKSEDDGILQRISNISGIEYLNNLNHFSIIGGNVADLTPLSKLIKLTTITIPYNRIVTLEPLSGLKNLKQLDFSYNSVSSLKPLSRLLNLVQIDAQENVIMDLAPLKSLNKLKILNISGNPADCAQLSSLKGLRFFYTDSQGIVRTCLSNGSNPNFIEQFFRYLTGRKI